MSKLNELLPLFVTAVHYVCTVKVKLSPCLPYTHAGDVAVQFKSLTSALDRGEW